MPPTSLIPARHTLESIINQLVQRHGWGEMGREHPVRCFQFILQ